MEQLERAEKEKRFVCTSCGFAAEDVSGLHGQENGHLPTHWCPNCKTETGHHVTSDWEYNAETRTAMNEQFDVLYLSGYPGRNAHCAKCYPRTNGNGAKTQVPRSRK